MFFSGKNKVDPEFLDQLEEMLIVADIGVETTVKIIDLVEDYVSENKYVDEYELKEILKDIQSGKFTKQWMEEHKSGQKNFLKMRKDLADHPIEKVGKDLRAMMPWIGKNKLVDKDKN